MTYTVRSVYKNKTKVEYGKSDAPLLGHSIVEEYNGVEKEYAEKIVSTIIDVVPGLAEPDMNVEQTSQIPDDVKEEIRKDYVMRYGEFQKLMTKLNEWFSAGSTVEFVYEFHAEPSNDTEESRFVSSSIFVKMEG